MARGVLLYEYHGRLNDNGTTSLEFHPMVQGNARIVRLQEATPSASSGWAHPCQDGSLMGCRISMTSSCQHCSHVFEETRRLAD